MRHDKQQHELTERFFHFDPNVLGSVTSTTQQNRAQVMLTNVLRVVRFNVSCVFSFPFLLFQSKKLTQKK